MAKRYVKQGQVHSSEKRWDTTDLRIEMNDRTVELGEGEMFVVPKGVRHNPIADNECLIMLIEKKTTLHTGDMITEKTRSLADQLRQA